MNSNESIARTYTDDSSNQIRGREFTRRRLMTRTEPFGIRAVSWYDTLGDPGDPLVGNQGGSAGFIIEPMAAQDNGCGGLTPTSRLGGPSIPGLNVSMFVDGGVIWVPFPATVYWDWPDKDNRNQGMVNYSIESWSGEFNVGISSGLSFTRYMASGQTITLNPMIRRAVCASPFGALLLPGGILMNTGQIPTTLGGALQIQMTFLPGTPGVISRLPVTFYYTI